MDLSLRAEYEGVNLGDIRREKRLMEMVEALARKPDASMPEVFSDGAELEGSYRFLRNEHVEYEAILAQHYANTAARARACGAVLAVHDTTEFNFGKNPRQDLGRVGQGKSHGFYGHPTFVVAQDSHLPLGVCALEPFRRDGKQEKNGGKSGHSKRHKDPTNEGLRWFRGVEATAATLEGCPSVIHLMDREADDFALLADMLEHGHRFVIRSAYDRRTLGEKLKLSDVLQSTPLLEGTREINLSSRAASSLPSNRKRHPPRKKRQARLSIRATKVVVPRPSSAPTRCPKTIELSLVQVLESSPPEGEEPVVWNLWTTEPCDTAEQVWAVVDAYRARWIIEEYFKVLKTGCSYESRQFETEASLLRLLAVFIPIAWWLLMLRTLERIAPNRPATAMLSPLHLRCLRLALKKIKVELPDNPSIRELLRGLARLGGHIKYNGAPGWLVVLRGLGKLFVLVDGFYLAQEEM